MKILVTGSTGLIGSALVPALTSAGCDVLRLVRRPVSAMPADTIQWDPAGKHMDGNRIEGVQAVVHLAGENIAARRWSARQKAKIRNSRVEGTRFLCESLVRCKCPPQVLVCASAIGYYGDRADEVLDETSLPGTGFLADVCQAWEAAAEPARDAGIRVVHLRCGIVLSRAGGALAKMLLPFRLGIGGVIGTGSQYWSWIAIDDIVGVIRHAIDTDGLHGPVNCVAPNAVTNREFTRVLGRVLHRPTTLKVPQFAARLALGEMGKELLLSSLRARPKRLEETGYDFQYTDLSVALRHVLEDSSERMIPRSEH